MPRVACAIICSGESVKALQFGNNGDFLACAGLKSIRIWNILSWELLWELDISSQCMSLSFVDNDGLFLGVLMKNNQLLVWDLATGLCKELPNWLDELDEGYTGHFHRLTAATLIETSSMLVVVYRGHDIIVWDIENERLHDIYGKETCSLGARARRRPGMASVLSLVFNRATEAGLLAASFNDGELVVFNTAEGLVQARTPANAHIIP